MSVSAYPKYLRITLVALLAVAVVLLVDLRAAPPGTEAAIPSGEDTVVVEVDTHRADNSEVVVEGPLLEDGVSYRVVVSGTYSVWFAGQWDEGVCAGATEPQPMFPSPGTTNGFVSADVAWGFAKPNGVSACDGDYPRDRDGFKISVDGGDDFSALDPLNMGDGPNAAHTYEFRVTGTGATIVFMFEDSITKDNYGILKATIEEAPLQSVEFTQGIQEDIGVTGLQLELAGGGQPPVPIVAGKPAALRVYMAEVDATKLYHVSVSGAVSGNRIVELKAGCTPELRRTQEEGCQSLDFFFTPPAGDWSATVTVRLGVDGPIVEEHEFNLTSVATVPLIVSPVTVCDSIVNPVAGTWSCGSTFNFVNQLPFLRNVYPGEVVVAAPGSSIYVDTDETPEEADWWQVIGDQMRSLWVGANAFENVHYYGVVRPGVDAGSAGGVASTIANASAGRMSVSREAVGGGSVETAAELIAQLIGTNIGLVSVPSANGCYGTPAETDPGWPNDGSPEVGEVGFDVALGEAMPSTYADVMSLCAPRWTSPYTYENFVEAFLTGGPAAQTSGLTVGDFWLISGTLDEETGEAEFDPVFELETEGDDGEGEGVYRIEVRDAGDDVLFTRSLRVDRQYIEDAGQQPAVEDSVVRFSELVPVQASAAKIVLLTQNTELGEAALGGETPVVELTSGVSTAGGEPPTKFSWSVVDADSAEHAYRIDLSKDGGVSWATIAPRFAGTSIAIDPAITGGGDGLLLRVLASDGTNTGSVVSEPFSLPTQAPTGAISTPGGGSYRVDDLVWLQAAVFDPEDGFLDDAAVEWSSSEDGALGTGASLPVYDLSEGTHTITMTASDGDGNEITDSIMITMIDGTVSEGLGLAGDVNCDGTVNAVDGLMSLRSLAGLSVVQTQPCQPIGSGDPVFGDVNCDGAAGSVDGLFILRHIAALPVNLPAGCPVIGT